MTNFVLLVLIFQIEQWLDGWIKLPNIYSTSSWHELNFNKKITRNRKRGSGDAKTNSKKKKPDADEEERKAQTKKSRQLTDSFNKIKEKIHQLERLTPTWDWHFEVEKNIFNSRSSKHKYKSAEKASDLPKRTSVDRISRLFKECLTNVKKIDENFVVSLKATKPEGESNRKKNIHYYVTPTETESGTEGSQESLENSSEEVLTSQEVDCDELTLSCRLCKDDIFLQDVTQYAACLKPAGKPHFAAHFQCLGLFPTSKSERMDTRHIYRCPAHS